MSERIAIYGGSFNPPGLHHRQIVEFLSREFDRVIIVPCGPRPDKQTVNDVDSVHRAALVDIAFRGLERVEVDLFDLEQLAFSPTDELEARYASQGEIWHVIGSDLVKGGEESFVHRQWRRGPEMWQQLKFAVLAQKGKVVSEKDLPPNAKLLSIDLTEDIASSAIRERIFRRQPVNAMIEAAVGSYIERYGLYRGRIPNRATRFVPEEPRLMIFSDERNPRSVEIAKSLNPWVDYQDPNLIVVIGGDGTMIRAIRKHWRRRLPFFGVNSGHLGFLLNGAVPEIIGRFEPGELTLYQLPMLYVEMLGSDGVSRSALAFNDAWLERATSQASWVKVQVNGRVRIPRLVSDGLLVSTAAGSNAYARSMGAPPLLVDTPAWLLVGSNVMNPAGWKSALLGMDASAEFTVENAAKRPVVGIIDGQEFGEVTRMRVRMSRIAAIELAFRAGHDMAEKTAEVQFSQARPVPQ